ncbi:MAG: type II secretion system protein [Chthoniobacterales bacterium]
MKLANYYKQAFTLIELLTVVAVLTILAGLILPLSLKSISKAKSASCLQNLRQLGAGLQLYLSEHQMRLPLLEAGRLSKAENLPVIDTLLLPYLRDSAVFKCPADNKIFKKSGTSYFWNTALNGQSVSALNFLTLVEDNSRIPVLCDKEGWHKLSRSRVNFLYADGHVTEELQLFATE